MTSHKNVDYYKYLYKYERGTSSTYMDSHPQPPITPPLQENTLTASSICGLTPASSMESTESPMQVIRKHIIETKTNTKTNTNSKTNTEIEQNEQKQIQKEKDTDDTAGYEKHKNEYTHCPWFVVDPISLIIKLAILSKKPPRTKISIVNHCITIHEPGMFQGIVRYYNNSNKQDLHYLQIPIETACMQYIILPTYQSQRQLFTTLFTHAACGLENLSKTYRNDAMVVLCINHYINMIHNSISINSMIMSKDADDHRKYYNESFIKKMKTVWTPDKMDIVLRLVESIDTSGDSTIRSLEMFMQGIDRLVGEE